MVRMLKDNIRHKLSGGKELPFLPTKISFVIFVVKNEILLSTDNNFLITNGIIRR